MPYKDPEKRKEASRRAGIKRTERRRLYRAQNPLPSRRKIKTPEEEKRFQEHRREYQRKYKREWSSKNKEYKLYWGARKRAEHSGRDFEIDVWDIVIPDVCPYLGVPFTKGNGPSIDRIDNSKGYTKDNIRVISRKANTMKHNATREELIVFAKKVLELHGSDL